MQIFGPTGAFVVVLAGVTAQYGFAGLQVATLMAGVILLAMGFAQLGGVIRLGRVPFMDATGTHTLSELIERFQRRGIRVLLCGIHPRLCKALERAEILALVGRDNICADMSEVARRVASA